MLDIIKEVLNIFRNNNYEAYVIGGFVRDYYLGTIADDIDISTNAHIEDVKRLFNTIVNIEEKYGAITVNYKNINIEITTFRKELEYENSRKPIKIEYVNNLKDDLLRRDFTINTLYMDYNLNIIDMYNGRDDINHKIIKCVGDAFIKIEEDSLRILRAIRFATILFFNIDNRLKNAIIKHKELLIKLSYERKREELDKIFNSKNIKYGIDLLLQLELHKELELWNLDNIVLIPNNMAIWAQLNTNDKYFTKQEKRKIKIIRTLLKSDITNNYILYKYDLSSIKIISEIKNINFDIIQKKYNELPIKSKKDINITFNDLKLILKTDENKLVRLVYENIEKAIIENKVENKVSNIKNYAIKEYRNEEVNYYEN